VHGLISKGDHFKPAVTYNGFNDEYLIVWMYEASPNVRNLGAQGIKGGLYKPGTSAIGWRETHQPVLLPSSATGGAMVSFQKVGGVQPSGCFLQAKACTPERIYPRTLRRYKIPASE
jgi:hypothetical protein